MGTLLSRDVLPSKTGTVPLDAVHACFGPGIALWYQPFQSALGGTRFVGVGLTVIALLVEFLE